jgi:hypothetical protein
MHLHKRLHQTVPHYATHDIECIKIMVNFRYSDDDTHMKLIDSPVQKFTYIMGKKYGPINVKPLFKGIPRVYIISRGFHSFQSLKAALWYLNDTLRYSNDTYYCSHCKVCKCIIPKGSWYYDGFVEYTNVKCYVSDSIIIKEIM